MCINVRVYGRNNTFQQLHKDRIHTLLLLYKVHNMNILVL